MNKDMIELIEEFIENAIIHGKATYDGDYKRGNKAGDKLFEICQMMKENIGLAQNMLDILLCNDEPNVKIWACSIALDMGYKVIEVEKMLRKLSEMPEIGILGFDAKMILETMDKL
ncbi:hypothetical protein Q428_13780 [Fervidicella metallireducens AeB]|uniref:DUF2019 domain-containing protein n=1 Tax=Fervidicella metallireducens AeB TaxID=1403537 RepID=A0A017RTX8_9CLOT|nr:hypothetical protein [Fervidicella metallireducens]EYE87360.1 hypothetical protein Q428_13780 [Fervidicella metallireducens AeB]